MAPSNYVVGTDSSTLCAICVQLRMSVEHVQECFGLSTLNVFEQ